MGNAFDAGLFGSAGSNGVNAQDRKIMKTRSLSVRAVAVCPVVLTSSLVAAGVYAQGTPLPVELLPLGRISDYVPAKR